MITSFRQGIVKYQLVGPSLLSVDATNAQTVDLNVIPDEPVIVTFAHKGANYIITENNSIQQAWGSGTPGSINAPLPQNQTEYLFWDIDIGTGVLSRGWTLYPPVYSSSAPLNPAAGQMWFDTVNTVFNVWTVYGTAPGNWVNCIRVFAGTYTSNATLTVFPTGSQVLPAPGLVGQFAAGNIILGTNYSPLRNSDGTFVTTASDLIIANTSGQNVSLDATLLFGEASEPIPAFSLVSFLSNQQIQLASSDNYTLFVNGIVTQSLSLSEVGNVITNGIVVNVNWSWPSTAIGAPVFCDINGNVTLTPPTVGVLQQIGTVYSNIAISLNISPPVRINGPTNLNPTVAQPITINSDGVFGQLPTGGIINAGGTSSSSFTVAGKTVLTQSNVGSSSICTGFKFIQSTAALTWAINHGGNTTNVVVSVYDSSNNQILPSNVSIVDVNNIQITFTDSQVGTAILILF
jgi:hypothetical protein